MVPDLEKILERLNGLESRGVIGPYAIGGAFAFVFYAEPIDTRDLDIFTRLPVSSGGLVLLDKLYAELQEQGCIPEGEAVLIEGYPVQILPESTPLVEEGVREAISVQVGKQTTRVFSQEHAVAIALQTNRAKDRLKIEHLFETGRVPLDRSRLEDILRRHGLLERWRRFLELRRG
jgi:hypothetical protein